VRHIWKQVVKIGTKDSFDPKMEEDSEGEFIYGVVDYLDDVCKATNKKAYHTSTGQLTI